jgi:hypothetical protein
VYLESLPFSATRLNEIGCPAKAFAPGIGENPGVVRTTGGLETALWRTALRLHHRDDCGAIVPMCGSGN